MHNSREKSWELFPSHTFYCVVSKLEGNFNSKKLSSFNITLVRVPYIIDNEIKALENSNMPNKEMIIKSLKTAIH